MQGDDRCFGYGGMEVWSTRYVFIVGDRNRERVRVPRTASHRPVQHSHPVRRGSLTEGKGKVKVPQIDAPEG